MSPDPHGNEPDDDFQDDEAPRSIFSAAWFRVVLVVLVLAVVGAVAVPYVLDVVNPPPTPMTVAKPVPPPPSEGAGARAAAPPAPATEPGAPSDGPGTRAAAPPAPATKPGTPSDGAGARVAATPAPATKPGAPSDTGARPPTTPAPIAKSKEPAAAETAKEAPKAKEPAPKVAAARATEPRARATASGEYFVQVGAFKDPETAKRVAARLREENYPVDESVKKVGDAAAEAPRAPAADRYDVLVSGGTAADINAKLAAKGLASEPAGEGVRIRPSLPLRDAVALSKDLGTEGFKVQVRRATASTGTTTAPPAVSAAAGAGQTLHRVRVGGYPDRATAQGVLRELEGKGYQPFIARGRD